MVTYYSIVAILKLLAKGEKANLDKYWDLDNHDPAYGKVLSQTEFYKFFTSQ